MIDLRDRAGRVAKQLGARTGQLHQVKDRITPAYN